MCWRHPTSLDAGPSTRATKLLNCIYTLLRSYHTFLPPIPPLCSLALLHPTSVGRKATSHVLTAPSPPTSPMHKSSVRCPCFSAPSGSKVTALDSSFFIANQTFLNVATVIFFDRQMKMHLLVLEFVALYIRGVQLVSLIVLSIGSPNQCFVNKVDEINESVQWMWIGL